MKSLKALVALAVVLTISAFTLTGCFSSYIIAGSAIFL